MSDPIHVCVITTAHPVDDVRVNNKFGAAFRAAGFRVSWVGPGHAFFDQTHYNRAGFDFTLGPPTRGRMDRLLARHRIGRLARTVRDVDVYYAPDPDSAELALALGRTTNAKVIFDIHEMYHTALLERWTAGRHVGFIQEYVRRRIARTAAACDLAIGVSETVLDAFVQRTAQNRLVVRSCAPRWFADGPGADVLGRGRAAFTVMHGKDGRFRGTDVVLRAAAIARRDAPSIRIVVSLQGHGNEAGEAQALRLRAESLGASEVLHVRPGVPLQEMPGLLRECDVGLISYERAIGADCLPNRLFEYMAVGVPVLAPSYAPEIARIIEAEGCGRVVDFEDPGALAQELLHLYRGPQAAREMGLRGREAFLARHNWDTEIDAVTSRIRTWVRG